MKLYLDTEFNGFGGRLISLALVSPCGKYEFYEVLNPDTYSGPGVPVDKWVEEHILPILNKAPISVREFQSKLSQFLFDVYNTGAGFSPVEIEADWPEDITHLTKMLICGPGVRVPSPPLTFIFNPHLPNTAVHSKVPHNALEDARSLVPKGRPKARPV